MAALQTVRSGQKRLAMAQKLSHRYDLFAREYVIDFNGARAAQAAGIREAGSKVWASRALTKANVRRRVDALLSARATKLEVKAERVLEELAKLAFLDPRNFYNEDGTLKMIHELDADTAACIAGVEYEKLYEHYAKGQSKPIGSTTKIKFHDKGQNLERLGRHLKLFTEKVEVSGDNALLDRLLAGRNRLNDPPKEGGAIC